jgi:hypothetical protein
LSTGKDKKIKSAGANTRSKQKSGVDVAEAVRDMISAQYPGMGEDDATRLAVMLTKAQFKGEI